jgi:hypothetical protein
MSNLETGLEPDAIKLVQNAVRDTGDTERVALLSLAISLKRIADSLCYRVGDENIFDLLNDIRYSARGDRARD